MQLLANVTARTDNKCIDFAKVISFASPDYGGAVSAKCIPPYAESWRVSKIGFNAEAPI